MVYSFVFFYYFPWIQNLLTDDMSSYFSLSTNLVQIHHVIGVWEAKNKGVTTNPIKFA